jgi:putative transposase
MNQILNNQFAPFMVGPHDRLTIEGKPFRLAYATNDAYVLTPAEGGGVAETFTFAHLRRLNGAGKIRHEIEIFLPEHMRSVRLGGTQAVSIAMLPAGHRKRVQIRHAMVQAYEDMLAEEEVKPNDDSIGGAMAEICKRAEKYLAEEVDLERELDEALAKQGKKRKSPGGKTCVSLAGVHPRTLREWCTLYRRGGKAALVDRVASRGNRSSFFSADENALLMAEVRKSYLHPNRPTIAITVQDVMDAFAVENEARVAKGLSPLRIPSREAVRLTVKKLDRFETLVARYGVKHAMSKMRPVGRGLEVTRPLERVEIDEWKIDLMTILAQSGLLALFEPEELKALGLTDEKGRWWLVVAIDCRTRVILGMKLTKDPKTSSAVECLRMVVSDKGQFSDAVGALTPWSQFGTPEMIVTDNGSAFKAIRFTDTCTALGSAHMKAIAGLAGMRGTNERWFQTCTTGLLPRLSGRTFGSIIEKADDKPADHACLSVDDLAYALVRWVVDIYHNRPHEGLGGRTPLQQWEIDFADGNYPLRAAPDTRTKRRAFGLSLSRKVSTAGITVLGVPYHSQTLAAWSLTPGSKTVDVRWDGEDLGAIEACLDGQWYEIPAVFDTFDGLHVREWIETRRALRAKSASRARWEEEVIRRAVADIRALNTRKRLEFGLSDVSLDEKTLKHLEDTLFASFTVGETTRKTSAPRDGHGQVIAPKRPDDLPESGSTASASKPLPRRRDPKINL